MAVGDEDLGDWPKRRNHHFHCRAVNLFGVSRSPCLLARRRCWDRVCSTNVFGVDEGGLFYCVRQDLDVFTCSSQGGEAGQVMRFRQERVHVTWSIISRHGPTKHCEPERGSPVCKTSSRRLQGSNFGRNGLPPRALQLHCRKPTYTLNIWHILNALRSLHLIFPHLPNLPTSVALRRVGPQGTYQLPSRPGTSALSTAASHHGRHISNVLIFSCLFSPRFLRGSPQARHGLGRIR